MDTIYIIVGALLSYPLLANMVIHMTRDNVLLRRKVFYISLVFVAGMLLATGLGVCTRSSYLNWWLLTLFYFVLCLGLWWTRHQPADLLKVICTIPLWGVLFVGYMAGTFFAIGLYDVLKNDFMVAEAWADQELSVKAYSRKEGLHVEVHKTVPFLTVLQYKVCERNYHESLAYQGQLEARYDKGKRAVYMAVIAPWGKDTHTMEWGDTIQLGH